jgi:hypothetical protein
MNAGFDASASKEANTASAESGRSAGGAVRSVLADSSRFHHAQTLFYTMLAAMAQFERECTMERIESGSANARANGTRSGKAFGQLVKLTESKLKLARIAPWCAGTGRRVVYQCSADPWRQPCEPLREGSALVVDRVTSTAAFPG